MTQSIQPRIRRIVAPNPGIMTYHGTNTYLVGAGDAFIVLDPGPAIEAHVEAILLATRGRIRAILLTHYHRDHCGAVDLLRNEVPAPLLAFAPAGTPAVEPDVTLADGQTVFGLQVIHTPGHAADHVCFTLPDGIVFSGDHVMSWSSSVVSPPLGNMADYCSSLRRLINRNDSLFLPGHGPPLQEPAAYTADLLHHRIEREEAILNLLRSGPCLPARIVETLYAKRDRRLLGAAERNVMAHLQKLAAEARVAEGPRGWTAL
ncbi:MBL fold metallo-hydrolase [Chelativorans alearense]|uniref:MBL fold metallo-hydrolase n=1 Tax=Chelativorans alearense TaxID=2681495 RepID=UPI001969D270|nr:MBL fold metallo-hydrolase [Chelativorans alearense]